MKELGYALRSLRHSPGFSVLVALTLALGIGAPTAFMSVVNVVLLSPLPYPDAERLVTLFQRAPDSGVSEDSMSPPQFRDILEQSTVFEELGMVASSPILLNREAPAEHSTVLWTSSSVLPMLGARAQLGRLFNADDDAAGSPFLMILTHEIWMRRYGGDPDIVGKTIGVEDGFEVEVVGVLEPGFLLDSDVFSFQGRTGRHEIVTSLPLTEEQRADRERELYRIVGRLRDDAAIAEARAQIDVIAERMLEAHPPLIAGESFSIEVVSLLEHVVGRVRSGLYWLLAAAGLLLLVANMNVASVMLARARKRENELAILAALGAGGRRLMTRVLLESFVLSMLGAGGGLLLAGMSLAAVRHYGPAEMPRLASLGVDTSTLVAAVLLAILTTFVSGIVPALRVSRVDPRAALRGAAFSRGVLRKGFDAPSLFAVAQVGLAFVLLVGAALISRSFLALLAMDPGFDAKGTLTMRVQERRDADRSILVLLDEIRELPGVSVVGRGGPLPFTSGNWWGPVEVEGYEAPPDAPAAIADRRAIVPDYFLAMRIPFIAGRAFDSRDFQPDAPPVRIVDRVFAETFWPDVDPIGQRIRQNDRPSMMSDEPQATVVGVVEHVRHYALEADGRMTVYLPATHWDRTFLVVRTEGDPDALTRPVVDAIRALDPDIAVSEIRTMAGRLEDHRGSERLAFVLVHAFSWAALVLAAVGLFGLIAFGVADGTREIGTRMTLGANERHIVTLVLRQGAVVIALGVFLGAALAFLASRFAGSLLHGVSATDRPTYVVIGALLGAVGLAACWIPARRASRFHPLEAMRREL